MCRDIVPDIITPVISPFDTNSVTAVIFSSSVREVARHS